MSEFIDCPEGRVLYTMIVPGGGLLLPSSRVLEVCVCVCVGGGGGGWGGEVG